MEIILAISTGFLLGYIWGVRKRVPFDKSMLGKSIKSTLSKREKGEIIHPIPPMVKRENQKMADAKARGEQGVPLDEL